MHNQQEFYPDIQTKYEHLITHMTDKNKVTDELIKIMKEICNLQLFYSNGLDKLANSVSKLLIGKDPIKDIFIIYQRILAGKCDESEKLANSIKDDLIPFLQASINLQAQSKLKSEQKQVKQMRIKMQKKLRGLYASEKKLKQVFMETKNINSISNFDEKDKIDNDFKKSELQLSDKIDSFNATVDQYMIKYAQICESLTEIQTERKYNLRDAVRKVVIMEIDYIKNLQYNLVKYNESLDNMEGKLLIQERIINSGQSFYSDREAGGVIQLAKLSNKNYIDHIVGKKNLEKVQSISEIKFREIRSAYSKNILTFQEFTQIVGKIFPIMDKVLEQLDPFLLKQIVLFIRDMYMPFQNTKIQVLNAILCHPLFSSESFWQQYGKKLANKISKEENMSVNAASVKSILPHLLSKDIQFLRLVEINPFVTNLIQQFSFPNPLENEQSLINQTKDTQTASENSYRNHSQKIDLQLLS